MTIEELRESLEELAEDEDYEPENTHVEADRLLLEYIGDRRVTELFDALDKFYA